METRVSLLTVLLVVLPLWVMSQNNKVKGNKEVVSISNDITEAYESIEISDNIIVEIQNSRRDSYVLTTDENLVNDVVVRVENSSLRIYTKSKITKSKKLDVFLSLMNLKRLVINGDAKVKITDNFNSEELFLILKDKSELEMYQRVEENIELHLMDRAQAKLDLETQNLVVNAGGNSSIKAKFDTKELKMVLDKAADAKLEGNVDHVHFDLKNRANLNAKKLKAGTATLLSKNKADIHIHATKSIEIDAEGKSKIYVYGNPEIKVEGLTDKSRIIKK